MRSSHTRAIREEGSCASATAAIPSLVSSTLRIPAAITSTLEGARDEADARRVIDRIAQQIENGSVESKGGNTAASDLGRQRLVMPQMVKPRDRRTAPG